MVPANTCSVSSSNSDPIDLAQELIKGAKLVAKGSESDVVLGKSGSIAFHIQAPCIVDQIETYRRLAKPFIVPGRKDLGSLIYYAGLGATAYPWQDIAMKLFVRSGMQTEAYPMAGHDGTWKSLSETTEEDWIADMQSKVCGLESKPIVFCYSTSLLVAFEVERRNPGTFQAIIGIGGPFFLSDKNLETYMDIGLRVDRISKKITAGRYSPVRHGSVPMEEFHALPATKQVRKSLVIERLPLPTALSLRRLQKIARTAAEEIHCPFFYAQGTYDRAISRRVPIFLQEAVPSKETCFRIYHNSGHGPQLGAERKEVMRDIAMFLKYVLETNNSDVDNIPDINARKPNMDLAATSLKAAVMQNIIGHKFKSLS